MKPGDFQWDLQKSKQNLAKHGVSFEEARSVFMDPMAATIADPLSPDPSEERFIAMGFSARQRLIVVVHCERGDTIRIISARQATRRERKHYEEGVEA